MKEDYNRFSPTQVLTEKQVPEDAIKIFYSYSRKDLDMRNALEDHLSALREAGRISTWHDLELEAGTEWEPTILHKLDTADIILLLISSSFIASKYCYGTELKRAIARHDAGTARVIPIILRPCDWNHSYVPFSKLNVLPTHAKPITQWGDQDEAFAIIAQRTRETVDQLNAPKQSGQQAAEQERLRQEQLSQQQEAEKSKQQELERQQQAQQHDADDLSSERNIDYTQLRNLLKAGKWKEADQETAQRMLEAMGRQQEGWLRVEDVEQFPCADLRTIDQLWVKYSSGNFGFSVQKKIWKKHGSPTEYNRQFENFGVEVGWRTKSRMGIGSEWKKYSDLAFDTSALTGHLPSLMAEDNEGQRQTEHIPSLVACNSYPALSPMEFLDVGLVAALKKAIREAKKVQRSFVVGYAYRLFSRVETCRL